MRLFRYVVAIALSCTFAACSQVTDQDALCSNDFLQKLHRAIGERHGITKVIELVRNTPGSNITNVQSESADWQRGAFRFGYAQNPALDASTLISKDSGRIALADLFNCIGQPESYTLICTIEIDAPSLVAVYRYDSKGIVATRQGVDCDAAMASNVDQIYIATSRIEPAKVMGNLRINSTFSRVYDPSRHILPWPGSIDKLQMHDFRQ